MHDGLSRLIHEVHRAVARGDMFVGLLSEFPGAREWANLIQIPIGVFDGKVLLKLTPARRAVTADGKQVGVVSQHDGTYYDSTGGRYTINEIAWVTEKSLPGGDE